MNGDETKQNTNPIDNPSTENIGVPLVKPGEAAPSSVTLPSLQQPQAPTVLNNNVPAELVVPQQATGPQIITGGLQPESSFSPTMEAPILGNTSFTSKTKAFSVKAAFILLALALIARMFHFGFGVFAGLLVFGGAGPLGPILLIFIPNIIVLYFGTKIFLSLSKKEAGIFSLIITTFIAFGLLNIIIGFNYSEALSGGSSLLSGLLSQFATFLSLWLVMSLLYYGIVLLRSGLKKKVFIIFGLILLIIVAINIYSRASVSNSFNEMVVQESADRYADISFAPYTISGNIEDYSLDNQAYITNYSSGLTDLSTYFVTKEGKSARHFSIQQYEYESEVNPAEKCEDLSGNQELYYPLTLKYPCVKIGETNQLTPVYFLQPDAETIQKKYLREDTAFTAIGNRIVIVRVAHVSDPEESLRIIREVIKKLETENKKVFFEQFSQITTRESSR